jgi:hypothetical protein
MLAPIAFLVSLLTFWNELSWFTEMVALNFSLKGCDNLAQGNALGS